MSVAHAIGVDPGLVHTGLVSLRFNTSTRVLKEEHVLVDGINAAQVKGWCIGRTVYVEKYKPRQNFGTDVRMVQGEQDLRQAMPGATFLLNMGIKKVVTQELMELLELWNWKPASHHQDLRSAARIALLGMMKNDVTNQVLATAVRETLDGQLWTVQHG